MYSVGDTVMVTTDPDLISHLIKEAREYAGEITKVISVSNSGRSIGLAIKPVWTWSPTYLVPITINNTPDHEAMFIRRCAKGG